MVLIPKLTFFTALMVTSPSNISLKVKTFLHLVCKKIIVEIIVYVVLKTSVTTCYNFQGV